MKAQNLRSLLIYKCILVEKSIDVFKPKDYTFCLPAIEKVWNSPTSADIMMYLSHLWEV